VRTSRLKNLRWILLILTTWSFAPSHNVNVTMLVRDEEGRALSALSKADFTISENGNNREILQFRNLRPPATLLASRPPDGYVVSNRPLAAFNFPQPVTILLLDTSNTDPEFQPWMLYQCGRFLSLLRPGEDVAVYQLTRNGLRLLHQFSHQTTGIENAMEPETAEEFERESVHPELRRRRYEATFTSLRQLAGYMSQFEGRMNLFWIAADFPSFTNSRKGNAAAFLPLAQAALKALNAANIATYPVEVRSAIPQESFERVAPGNLTEVPRTRRRVMNSDLVGSMTALAAVTGGKPIQNRSQLGEAMFDSMEATRFAYELGFTVPEADWDGHIHDLKVQTRRHDATLLVKTVFTASEEPATSTPGLFDSPRVGLSIKLFPPTGADLPIQLFIAARDLGWKTDRTGRTAQVDILAEKQSPPSGTVLKTQTFSAGSNAPDKPLSAAVTVPRPKPGSAVRITVRDRNSGRLGSVTLSGRLSDNQAP
jgi:VWFA-related protein